MRTLLIALALFALPSPARAETPRQVVIDVYGQPVTVPLYSMGTVVGSTPAQSIVIYRGRHVDRTDETELFTRMRRLGVSNPLRFMYDRYGIIPWKAKSVELAIGHNLAGVSQAAGDGGLVIAAGGDPLYTENRWARPSGRTTVPRGAPSVYQLEYDEAILSRLRPIAAVESPIDGTIMHVLDREDSNLHGLGKTNLDGALAQRKRYQLGTDRVERSRGTRPSPARATPRGAVVNAVRTRAGAFNGAMRDSGGWLILADYVANSPPGDWVLQNVVLDPLDAYARWWNVPPDRPGALWYIVAAQARYGVSSDLTEAGWQSDATHSRAWETKRSGKLQHYNLDAKYRLNSANRGKGLRRHWMDDVLQWIYGD